MAHLIVFLLLADLGLIFFALSGCLEADERSLHSAPRGAWILFIVLFAPIGPLAWFLAGRAAAPVPSAPFGPEDDPRFIADLAELVRQRD